MNTASKLSTTQAINRLERQLKTTAELFARRKAGSPLSLDEVLAALNLEEAIVEAAEHLSPSVSVAAAGLPRLGPAEDAEDEYSHREQCEIYLAGCGPSCEED